MVVAEGAVRERARAYREGLTERWPRSQVAFASKAFACTAVQRLMASEGLWLDVAGRETWTDLLARDVDP